MDRLRALWWWRWRWPSIVGIGDGTRSGLGADRAYGVVVVLVVVSGVRRVRVKSVWAGGVTIREFGGGEVVVVVVVGLGLRANRFL